MKNIIFLSITFLVFISFNISFSGTNNWELINPKPTPNTYFNIFKTKGNTLLSIGKHELLLLSHDNGDNWTRINVDTSGVPFYPDISFSEIDFFNNFGLILESRGHLLLRTQDYGNNWQYVPNFDLSLYSHDLHCTTADIGFIAGWEATFHSAQVYRTIDGGSNWENIFQSPNSKFYNINVFSDSIGYVHDSQRLFKTTNMGQDWSLVYSLDSTSINHMYFENSTTGYLVLNDGTVLKTENSANSFSIFHRFFSYTVDGYFHGNYSHILSYPNIVYSTIDSGQTWHTTYLPTNGLFMLELSFSSPDTGYVVGNYGEIYRTYDAGFNWSRLKESFTDDSFYDLSYVDPNKIYAAARTGIYKTLDKGYTWQKLQNLPNNYFPSISFPSDQLGYASTQHEIFKTIDGGNSWTSIFNPNEYITRIRFLNDSVGVIIGSNGIVYKTFNGGVDWENISVPYQLELNGLYLHDLNCYTVVGISGYIFQTNNAGTSWNYYQTSQHEAFEDVDFYDPMNGIVVGHKTYQGFEGLVYKTTDGGQTWLKQQSTTWSRLESIHFYSDSLVISAGDDGAIIYSKDGGISWQLTNEKICNLYYSIRFLDRNNILAVGQLGMIVLNNNFLSDIPQRNIIQPQNFILFQNYPNPFNLETNIKFYLPKSTNLNIEIYDVNGRLINNVFSGILMSGLHQTSWNGRNSKGQEVASGIYIYQLKTKGFVESKKLVLIK